MELELAVGDRRFADESLFLAHLTAAKPQSLNLIVQCRVHGTVDVQRWSSAIDRVFGSHGLPQRRFESGLGDGAQALGPHAHTKEVVVHECLDDDASETLARALVEAEKEFVFDISGGVLFRNTLVAGPGIAFWLVNLHHGIADGWSISLLIDQVEHCYTHGLQPEAGRRERGDIPLRRSTDARDFAFWRETFDTAHRNLESVAQPAVSARAVRHAHRFTRAQSERIHTYRRSLGISLNDFFTAVLGAYFFHAHSLAHITFEVSLHGRASPADKASVGKYVKFVPLNLELCEQLEFSQLCEEVRSRNRQLLRHHRFAIHSRASRERGLVRPNMPFAINYQSSKHTNRFAGNPLYVDWIFSGYDEHWLTLNVNDFHDEEITLSVDVNLSMSDSDCPALVLKRLVAIADEVLDRSLAIGDISPLCDIDTAVLDSMRNTVAPATDGLFHLRWLVEPPAAASACAVLAEDVSLSHGEFRARIDDCRGTLRRIGCGPHSRVVVCLDNGWPAMAWTYAIWLESGTYVPVGYDSPRARVETILTATSATLLVSDRPELQALTDCLTLPAIPPSTGSSAADAGSLRGIVPESVAYILFTSGSTGVPKGVMVSHQAISEYAAQFVAYFGVNASDRVLQQASMAFDASFEEFLPALAVGGAVVPWNRYRLLEPDCLLSVLRRFKVSLVSVSPIMMGELNRQFRELPALRIAISGGDVLEWPQCDHLVSRGVAVYNTYGPTEATVCATYKKVGDTRITIGSPIRNTNVYVVNERLGLVGLGVPGELAIAGLGVAKGYLDDPDASALRFRSNPFTQSVHDRTVYLTGDRGMVTASGELVFLGRTDDQISINGYRVELREVEAAISSCPGVESRAVWFDRQSHRVVACYTGPAEIDTVRALLRDRLPRHMIPHGWHRFESLPLNQSGKIDMERLREACLGAPPVTDDGAVPLPPFAAGVAAVWREILDSDAVIGSSSCFFALGGNSLKLLELVRVYANRLGVACALEPLLSDSTLSSHVHLLESAQPQVIPPFAGFAPVDRWPATPQQRAMIAEEAGSRRTGLYNVPALLSWRGSLDRQRFALGLEVLRTRHPILQCEWKADGTFARALQLPVELTFDSTDASDSITAWLNASTGVDLLSPGRLPWKVMVLEHDDARHTVLFLFHHALVDAWSLRVLDQDFQQIYSELGRNQLDADRCTRAVAPAYDFSSYAQWVAGCPASMSDREKEQVAEEFGQWPDLFSAAPGHAAITSSAIHERIVQAPLSRDVEAFCSAEHLSLHNVLQSLFALTLCRWMDSPAVVMGVPANNRDSSAAASLVGCFINTMLVKTEPQPDESVYDLLRRAALAEQRRAAMASVPLQQVLTCLLEARCHVPESPVEVYFAIDDIPRQVHDREGRRVQTLDHQLEPGRSAIALVIVTGGEGWRLQWKYSPALFDAPRIAALAEYYESVVVDAISAPLQQLRTLMGREWRDSRIVSPEPPCDVGPCLIERIRQQAIRQPHAQALVAGSRRYTYTGLWQQAERYAFALQAAGVQPGDFVVLALEKCPEFVQLVLATWMVGAAVTPHDGELWFDADEQWCAENAVSLVIHAPGSDPGRRPARGMSLHDIGMLAESADGQTRGGLLAHLEAPAYRIYTSGSTGTPKGVEVSHRNLANFALGFSRQAVALGMTGLTSWLWNHSFGFDASMKGYAALAEGAMVVLPTSMECKSPEALAGHVAAHEIDVVNFIPSQLRFVLPLLRARDLRIHIISSGDAIDLALEDDLHRYCEWAGTRALNAYGPTETTVNATFGRLERGRRATIGKPVTNVCAWVVGGWGTPQPPGAVGELWICGESVAIGYRNQETLTAEKFLVLAADDDGPRCYRSGDIVHLDAHGEIVILGRHDRQTKVRGYRIELKGIEAVARRVVGVDDCAVFCNGDDIQLVIVARTGCAAEALVRERLQKDLPHYMVPARIHTALAIPYTYSGKLDESRLRQLCGPAQPAGEAARGAGWIGALLGLATVDLSRSFMQNGGNSVKALVLQADIQRQWGKRIALEPLFAEVPLATLVAQWGLDSPRMAMNDDSAPDCSSAASSEEAAMWLAHQADTSGVAYNMAVMLQVEGDLPVERLSRAYRAMLEAHPALCSYFVLEQGRLVIEYCDPGQQALPFEVLESPTSQGIGEALEVVGRGFQLDRPYLHRMILIRHTDRSSVVLFNIHHILVDGTSVDILMRGLFARPSPVAVESTVPRHSRPRSSRETPCQEDLQFWRRYLSSCAGTRLPRRVPISAPAPVETALQLSADESSVFFRACDARTVTPFQWLLTQVAVHLGQHIHSCDVILLSPLEMRSAETRDVVGLYSRTLAYRIRWGDGEAFDALLSRQKKDVLSAWQHGSLGFDELRQRLGGDLARTILEAGFTWHGGRDVADAFEGLTVSVRPLPLQAVKYPLWVHARVVDGCLRFELESASDILDAQGAQRFLETLAGSLRATVATSDSPIGDLRPTPRSASRPNEVVTFDFDF